MTTCAVSTGSCAGRGGLWTAVAMPTLWLSWDLMWTTAPDLQLAPPVVMVLSRLTDVTGLATALLCLVARVVLEVGGRRLRAPEGLAKAVAGTTLVGVFGVLATSVAMTLLNTRETAVLVEASSTHELVGSATVVGLVVVVRSAIRCLRSAGPIPARASGASTAA